MGSDQGHVATLSLFFGVLTLRLAGLGLYGLISYGVAKRRPEISLRIGRHDRFIMRE